MSLLSRRVGTLNITLIGYCEAIAWIVRFAHQYQQGYVCFANAHMTVEAYRNRTISDKINQASMVLADGVPVQKSLALLYGVRQERIAGMDIFPDLLREAAKEGLSVFFFGTTNEILEKINQKAVQDFPTLRIAGMFSPPFGTNLNSGEYLELINKTKPHLVFVALGCPKQEIWMSENYKNINALLLGVGGAFPVYAGVTRRAPLLFQKYGLEWAFRLAQEPRRLFKRYFITNLLFISLIVRQLYRRSDVA